MKALLQEYGYFAIAAVGILVTFAILKSLFVGDTSIVANQALAAVDMGTDGGTVAPDESSWGITNVTTDEDKTSFPYFEIDPDKEYVFMPDDLGTETVLGSATTLIKRDFLMDGVKAYYDNSSGKHEISSDNITINVTIYEPRMTLSSNTSEDSSQHSVSITGQMLFEEVRAVDRFGNLITDAEGNYVLTKRAAYKRNSRDRGLDSKELAANDYTDYGTYLIDFGGVNASEGYTSDEVAASDAQGVSEWILSSDLPYKVKVVYRAKNGTLTSEYTAIYTNQLRNQRPLAEEYYATYFTEGTRNFVELDVVDTEPDAVVNILSDTPDYEWEGYHPEIPEKEEEPTPSPSATPTEDGTETDEGDESADPTPTSTPDISDDDDDTTSDDTTSDDIVSDDTISDDTVTDSDDDSSNNSTDESTTDDTSSGTDDDTDDESN